MGKAWTIWSFARWLLAAAIVWQMVACQGTIIPPTPVSPGGTPALNSDMPCPTSIPDQPTTQCPRLKNITITCGGNGTVHTGFSGGSGQPFILGAKFDDGSVISAVFVVVNCQDGPREGITFGVTYTGQVSTPETGSPCISQSKAVYSQFQFGNPLYAGLEGVAKDQMHQALDDRALASFAAQFGLATPAMSRCGGWREMP